MSDFSSFAKRHFGEMAKDMIYYVGGSILFGLSINVFTAPAHIAPGGVSGIGIMLNYLYGWPIGTVGLLLNIPIFIWAIMEIGYRLVGKTIVATVIVSFMIDFVGMVVPAYTGNPILAAIYGGCLEGAGLSLVFLRGATTGGTDLIARLLGRRVRFVSLGKLMLGVDFIIVLVSALVYQSMESALYAVIAIFVSTKLIDTILYGTDIGTGKIMFIISEHSDEIAKGILTDLERGVTILDSRGGYTGRESNVLLCAVRRYEVAKVKDIVRSVDKNAFFIIGEAGEISGEGFRKARPEDKTLRELMQRQKKK